MEDLLPTDAQRRPIVAAKGNEVFADSRDVAAYFGKRHTEVLRTIHILIAKEPDLGRRNFASFKIKDLTGERTSHYEMDKRGFTLLAMGFTGEQALKWKIKYIDAFELLEAELSRRNSFDAATILNDPAAMRGILLSYTEKVLALEAEKAVLVPKADALDRIAETDGSMCVSDAAKTLQVKPKQFFRFMREQRWIFWRVDHYVAYQPRLDAGLMIHKVVKYTTADGVEKIAVRARVTTKGLTELAKAFPPSVRRAG